MRRTATGCPTAPIPWRRCRLAAPPAKDSRSTSTALRGLSPADGAIVLAQLLDAHPDLAGEAEELARRLAMSAGFEAVAHELEAELVRLGFPALRARAGRKEWGYSDPCEAAAELVTETVEPFLDDLERLLALGETERALAQCQGIVAGLYRAETGGKGDVLGEAQDVALETAGFAIDTWVTGARKARRSGGGRAKPPAFPSDFLATHASKWREPLQDSPRSRRRG